MDAELLYLALVEFVQSKGGHLNGDTDYLLETAAIMIANDPESTGD